MRVMVTTKRNHGVSFRLRYSVELLLAPEMLCYWFPVKMFTSFLINNDTGEESDCGDLCAWDKGLHIAGNSGLALEQGLVRAASYDDVEFSRNRDVGCAGLFSVSWD